MAKENKKTKLESDDYYFLAHEVETSNRGSRAYREALIKFLVDKGDKAAEREANPTNTSKQKANVRYHCKACQKDINRPQKVNKCTNCGNVDTVTMEIE